MASAMGAAPLLQALPAAHSGALPAQPEKGAEQVFACRAPIGDRKGSGPSQINGKPPPLGLRRQPPPTLAGTPTALDGVECLARSPPGWQGGCAFAQGTIRLA